MTTKKKTVKELEAEVKDALREGCRGYVGIPQAPPALFDLKLSQEAERHREKMIAALGIPKEFLEAKPDPLHQYYQEVMNKWYRCMNQYIYRYINVWVDGYIRDVTRSKMLRTLSKRKQQLEEAARVTRLRHSGLANPMLADKDRS